MLTESCWRAAASCLLPVPLCLFLFGAAAAQTPPPAPPQEPEPTQSAPQVTLQAEDDDEDMRLDPAQPDFTLINLPTTLRVPRFRSAFRVTHRFTRSLGEGDAGDLLDDFFGFDSAALIGLEFRIGLARGFQVGIHRTSAKTIQLFGQYSVVRPTDARPLAVDALVAFSGTDNLRNEHAPTLGLLASHKIGRIGAVYVEPIAVFNSHPTDDPRAGEVDEDYTLMVGLGTRLRISPTVYVVLEAAPKLAGYQQGSLPYALALEKRVGGHAFQIVFANSIWTTYYDLASFGGREDDLYIGFNISRKFF